MSTQQALAIDFSVAQNFANFQLVELPEELLQVIAGHKSDAPVLYVKSEAQSCNAVICTPTKTHPIRSVHTSNSLLIVQPAVAHDHDQDTIPSYGIQAISSCGATLELLKASESALPYLRKVLPIYSSRELNAAAAAKSSFGSISADIPLSDGEILTAWSVICAFEEQGASYRPTADILLQLWKAVTTAAVAETIDLSTAFLTEDLWSTVKDDEFPRGLFDTLLQRVEDRNYMDVDAGSRWCSVDKARCSEWIAALVLETRTIGDQTMAVSEFLNAWADTVFEDWRSDLNLEAIQDIITQPTPATIALRSEHRLAGIQTSAVPVSGATNPTKARKWHEKFKKSRT